MTLATPPGTARPRTAWILTDGKAGDELQCLGVAEALGVSPELRRVRPRPPFVWTMPWFGIDPAEAPAKAQSPIRPPFPDIVLASGRRAVTYLRHVKQASAGRTFTVFLKDPRVGAGAADFIWVPAHDRLRGPNVLVTDTSPHRFSAARLAAERQAPWPVLADLPRPRIAIVLGGDSRRVRYEPADFAAFVAAATAPFAAESASFMVTASRRTPPAFAEAVSGALAGTAHYWWDGTGDNPYPQMLALADGLVVSGDSVNMVDEALATGAPVRVFQPKNTDARVADRLARLAAAGLVDLWMRDGPTRRLEKPVGHTIDSTPTIAAAILERYAAFHEQAGPA
ncbi:MAG: mitochondrial fission ELM1 family protein [Hyphomicrobiales bacterium]